MKIVLVEILLPVRKRPGHKRRFRVDDGQPLDLRERSGQRLFVRFAGLVREIGRFQIVQRLVFERQHAAVGAAVDVSLVHQVARRFVVDLEILMPRRHVARHNEEIFLGDGRRE